jgi:tripartite-type tricarboxylate transporter receptor subunit TctC
MEATTRPRRKLMNSKEFIITTTLLLLIFMFVTQVAFAQQAYPNKPIRLIVPNAPGGSNSVMAQLLGKKLTESWGQQVIVDNRPGGNTVIGCTALLKSPPDGYTLMLISSAHVTVPNLIHTPYDAVKDFAPVATLAGTDYILALHHSVPANNLREFIALAKSKPGQLNYSSSGEGGGPHLAAALFCIAAGVDIQHVPYTGAGPALIALVGGHVQMSCQTPVVAIPQITTGNIKAMAISGETHLLALPKIPTATEAGLPGFQMRSWYGVIAPSGTPRQIIDKLSAQIAKILTMNDYKENLVGQGLDPLTSTPDQFTALMKTDLAKFGKIIKTANIKLE